MQITDGTLNCIDTLGRSCTAWRIPPLGEVADADVPDFIMERFLEGTIEFADLGGLTGLFGPTPVEALPGHYVVSYPDDTIEFCSESTFDRTYSVH